MYRCSHFFSPAGLFLLCQAFTLPRPPHASPAVFLNCHCFSDNIICLTHVFLRDVQLVIIDFRTQTNPQAILNPYGSTSSGKPITAWTFNLFSAMQHVTGRTGNEAFKAICHPARQVFIIISENDRFRFKDQGHHISNSIAVDFQTHKSKNFH